VFLCGFILQDIDSKSVDPEKVIFRHIEVEDCGLLGLTG
jgi:hypothetical protein